MGGKNMDRCSVISLKDIKKIKSINSDYVIITDKDYEFNFNFNKIINFMKYNNYQLYALCCGNCPP